MKSLKLIIAVSTLALTVSGCFRLNKQGSDSSASTDAPVAQRTDDEIQSNSRTLAVVGTTHVVAHMKAITGVATVSTDAVTKYGDKKDSFSTDGSIDSINSPMWIALADLGGEFCNSVVTGEAAAGATRKFFGTVDFTKNSAGVTDDIFNASVDKLATSFWGRLATADEHTLLLTNYRSAFTADTAKTPNQSLIWVCSAMLASRSAQEF